MDQSCFCLGILRCNPTFTSFYHLSTSRRWRHNRRTKTKVQKPNPWWFNGISGWYIYILYVQCNNVYIYMHIRSDYEIWQLQRDALFSFGHPGGGSLYLLLLAGMLPRGQQQIAGHKPQMERFGYFSAQCSHTWPRMLHGPRWRKRSTFIRSTAAELRIDRIILCMWFHIDWVWVWVEVFVDIRDDILHNIYDHLNYMWSLYLHVLEFRWGMT